MLAVLAVALAADAAPTTLPTVKPSVSAALGASCWGLGLRGRVTPGLKVALWNEPGSLLFSDTFLRVEVELASSPSFGRVIPTVVFSPIAVLKLSAHAAYTGGYETFSTIKVFDDQDAVEDDPTLAGLENHAGAGWR
jgi:hypothetical protein